MEAFLALIAIILAVVMLVRSSDQKHRLDEMQRILAVLTKRIGESLTELKSSLQRTK